MRRRRSFGRRSRRTIYPGAHGAALQDLQHTPSCAVAKSQEYRKRRHQQQAKPQKCEVRPRRRHHRLRRDFLQFRENLPPCDAAGKIGASPDANCRQQAVGRKAPPKRLPCAHAQGAGNGNLLGTLVDIDKGTHRRHGQKERSIEEQAAQGRIFERIRRRCKGLPVSLDKLHIQSQVEQGWACFRQECVLIRRGAQNKAER